MAYNEKFFFICNSEFSSNNFGLLSPYTHSEDAKIKFFTSLFLAALIKFNVPLIFKKLDNHINYSESLEIAAR